MKKAVFWDMTPCDSYQNRRFGQTYRLHQQDDNNRGFKNNVRSEVFTAMTMKNGVFWDVTSCGSYVAPPSSG
jgi:hypothetical protein